MADREITLSVPEELLRDVETLAAARKTSISQLLADALADLVKREATRASEYEAARRRHMAMLEIGFDLGTNGKITWTRDELHDRKL